MDELHDGRQVRRRVLMTEMTPDESLRQAAALVGQALRETEARCTVLGQFINDCEAAGSKTAAWSDALREFHALHGYRIRLLRRHNLLQQALGHPVGERPATVLLPPVNPPIVRTQRQLQIQMQARRQQS
jgi:hypothetical protein